MDKTNQPYSYMMQDIEKGEKELNYAQKKARQLNDDNKRLKDENDSLKIACKGLKEDLNNLNSKKKEIDNLQSTLLAVVRDSSSKKVSVDYIRKKLANTATRTVNELLNAVAIVSMKTDVIEKIEKVKKGPSS